MTPNGVAIENPAFDVTPAKYVSAIITERGVLRAPYEQSIQKMAQQTISEPELATT
jgi:methylthioribose-1-phosphate isomerase